MHSCSADVVVLTESWLNSEIPNSELSALASYNIFRKDRQGKKGGGVLIAVINSLNVLQSDIAPNIEVVWVRISTPTAHLLVVTCYKPPGATDFPSLLNDHLETLVNRFPMDTIVLAGDFNYPDIEWPRVPAYGTPFYGASLSTSSREFVNIATALSLSQVVNQPTRGTAVLDLFFTTNPELVSAITYLEPLSDHIPINVVLSIPILRRLPFKKTIFSYPRANIDAIHQYMSIFATTFFRGFQSRTVEENWRLVKGALIESLNRFVPRVCIATSSQQPWFSAKHTKLLRKKKRLFRLAKSTGSPDTWIRYRDSASQYKYQIKNSKHKYFDCDLQNLLITNPQKFWLAIRPPQDRLPSKFTDPDGNDLTELEACETMNLAFCSVFTEEDFPLPMPISPHEVVHEMAKFDVSPAGIEKLINDLPFNSAPGPDGISTKLLKLTKEVSCVLLSSLFNQSLSSCDIPVDWRHAKVTPVFKNGSKMCITNYRPISLTSVPSKLMEHVIYSQIMNHLSSNNLLFANQHGFRRSLSCESQLFELTTDIHESLHAKTDIHAIFIDFSKAFDKVPHCRLIQKLHSFHIDRGVINWIESFLTPRTQYVSLHEQSSTTMQVRSGVPQGTVLGPLLFLIYVNDLSLCINSTLRLFADDCVMYSRIHNVNDCSTLQNDLVKIESWCGKWQMEINVQKTKSMVFSTKRVPTKSNYTLFNNHIEQVMHYKYLGVFLSSNLSWEYHVNHISAKANKSLGFLRRSLYLASQKTKLTAYTALIRPILEYASAIWNPHQVFLEKELESIQNKAARFILRNYNFPVSVTSLKTSLQLPLLKDRRTLNRLKLLHKLFYHSPSRKSIYCKPAPFISRRLDHPCKLHLDIPRTNLYKFSPLQLAISDWNQLPEAIVTIIDPQKFADNVAVHLHL